MTVQKLEKADWSPFFNHLSKTLAGSQAEIDVGSLALGGQVQANWVALIGLVYDPKDDLVEVALEGLDHLIHNPRDIYIEQGNGLDWRVLKSSMRKALARSSSSRTL